MKIASGRTRWGAPIPACSLIFRVGPAGIPAPQIIFAATLNIQSGSGALAKGVRITLVDAGPDSGFYHVRTRTTRLAGVFSKYVTVLESAPPGTPTDAGTSTPGALTGSNV